MTDEDEELTCLSKQQKRENYEGVKNTKTFGRLSTSGSKSCTDYVLPTTTFLIIFFMLFLCFELNSTNKSLKRTEGMLIENTKRTQAMLIENSFGRFQRENEVEKEQEKTYQEKTKEIEEKRKDMEEARDKYEKSIEDFRSKLNERLSNDLRPVIPSTKPVMEIQFVWGLWDDIPFPKIIPIQWQKKNPSFEINVWNTETIEALIQDRNPSDMEYWNRADPIFKSDFARIFILAYIGGFYFDADISPFSIKKCLSDRKSINPSVVWIESTTDGHNVLAWAEKYRKGLPEYDIRISNFAMVAKYPNQPFYLRVLRFMRFRWDAFEPRVDGFDYKPLHVSGPDVVTESVFGIRNETYLNIHPEDRHSENFVDIYTRQGNCFFNNMGSNKLVEQDGVENITTWKIGRV